jgi:hypothetical protein
MRVNVYAEEMTDRIEIISKEIDGHAFTGLRFYMELPATIREDEPGKTRNVRGPFIHRVGDDDSAAVTFWGKRDLRSVLREALVMLDAHYEGGTPDPDDEKSDANRYHQLLGAKWMVEAIVEEMRTRFEKNANAQLFASHIEDKWKDEVYWRGGAKP